MNHDLNVAGWSLRVDHETVFGRRDAVLAEQPQLRPRPAATKTGPSVSPCPVRVPSIRR